MEEIKRIWLEAGLGRVRFQDSIELKHFRQLSGKLECLANLGRAWDSPFEKAFFDLRYYKLSFYFDAAKPFVMRRSRVRVT